MKTVLTLQSVLLFAASSSATDFRFTDEAVTEPKTVTAVEMKYSSGIRFEGIVDQNGFLWRETEPDVVDAVIEESQTGGSLKKIRGLLEASEELKEGERRFSVRRLVTKKGKYTRLIEIRYDRQRKKFGKVSISKKILSEFVVESWMWKDP